MGGWLVDMVVVVGGSMREVREGVWMRLVVSARRRCFFLNGVSVLRQCVARNLDNCCFNSRWLR